MSRLARIATFAAAVLTVAACGDQISGLSDNSTDGSPDSTANPEIPPPLVSSTTLLLTDAPFPYDRVARVDIWVERVAVSTTADTGTIRDYTGAEFITAATPDRRINVLELQNGSVDTLGGTALPAGDYRSLQLVIDADSSSITLKDGRVLTRSSTPGINWQLLPERHLVTLWALVPEPLGIPDTGGTVVVDFDVGMNFVPIQDIDSTSSDEGFLSFNFVRAVTLERSGTIQGRAVDSSGVTIADATVTAFLPFDPTLPENTWLPVATARTDADGDFTVAYLTPTDFYPTLRRYIIGIDGAAGSEIGSARYFDLSLSAGETRDMGNVVVPRF